MVAEVVVVVVEEPQVAARLWPPESPSGCEVLLHALVQGGEDVQSPQIGAREVGHDVLPLLDRPEHGLRRAVDHVLVKAASADAA